jgi:hypothetical protein
VLIDSSTRYTIDDVFAALCGLVFGIFLLVKGVKLAAKFGTVVPLTFILMACFWYTIPGIFPSLGETVFGRIKWSTVIAIACYLVAKNLSDRTVCFLYILGLVPLIYQLLGFFFQLLPEWEWRVIKLVVAIVVSVLLSPYLVREKKTAAQFVTLLTGSLLIAASVEYIFEGGNFFSWFWVCITRWESRECNPFHAAWIVSLATSLLSERFLSQRERRTEDSSTSPPRARVAADQEESHYQILQA